MVHKGVAPVGVDRAPSIARNTEMRDDVEPPSSKDLTNARRPEATALRALVSVSPLARRSAICLASVPVSRSPSSLAAAGSIDASEEANFTPGEINQETSVEEPVGSFA